MDIVYLVTIMDSILQQFIHLRCVFYRKYLLFVFKYIFWECVHLGLSYSCMSVILFTTSAHVSFRCLWLTGRSEAEHFCGSTSQLSPPLYSLAMKSTVDKEG